jgi:CelD/BcsL family acetyltransferase involved in cellulose biosynthesis
MAKYSPGSLLLLQMAEHAQSLGLNTIDLGKGMSPYKERLMNASVPLAHGFVGLPSWVTARRKGQKWLRALVAKSPLATPARSAVQWARGWSQNIQ